MLKRLLTGTGVYGALTVASAVMAPEVTIGTAALTGASSLIGNILASDAGQGRDRLIARIQSRLSGPDAVLQNHDLTKAVGLAIA